MVPETILAEFNPFNNFVNVRFEISSRFVLFKVMIIDDSEINYLMFLEQTKRLLMITSLQSISKG